MALDVDSSSPIRFAGTPAADADITSASFTAPAGAIIVVCISEDVLSGETYTFTVTDSGGLTWTEQIKHTGSGSQLADAAIWTSSALPSATPRTVSVQHAGGDARRLSVKVYVVTGQDSAPIGVSGHGQSATNNLTTTGVTTTANAALLFAAATEWNALGAPASADLSADAANYSGAISVISGYKSVPAAGAGKTANLDASGSSAAAWSWCVLEIKPAPAAHPSFSVQLVA